VTITIKKFATRQFVSCTARNCWPIANFSQIGETGAPGCKR
jgi:hypothetical protein